tara:strand:+ start:116 stop:409 length:294 start_codon:yes stop_codon:yes gene_type:complete
MEIAKEINKKLDELSKVTADLNELKSKYNSDPEFQLKNSETGELVDKDIVFDTGEKNIQQIKDDLNKLTNNGEHIKNIFTNPYYINDFSQDKNLNSD